MAGTASVIVKAINQGREEGRAEIRKIALDFLEEAYLSNKVERDTPLSNEILELAGELSKLMKVK